MTLFVFVIEINGVETIPKVRRLFLLESFPGHCRMCAYTGYLHAGYGNALFFVLKGKSRMVKKIWVLLLKVLLVIIAFLAVYALAVWLLPYIAVNKNAGKHGRGDISIYIKTNGVHTDIVMPVKNEEMDWTSLIKYEHTDAKDPDMAYVGIGWGDKGFYLQTPEWKDLKFSVAFKAMFHLSTSALHTTFYKHMVIGEDCKEIKLTAAEYQKLVDYIVSSFKKDTDGNSIHIPSKDDGYGDTDAFYEANGKYNLFNTCNTWSNRALKACGQKACLWTALDKGIFYHYRDK